MRGWPLCCLTAALLGVACSDARPAGSDAGPADFDLSGFDFSGLDFSCFVIDPPPQGCACNSFYRKTVGSLCSPVGVTCFVIQDNPSRGATYQYEIACGADGHSQCLSASCPPLPLYHDLAGL